MINRIASYLSRRSSLTLSRRTFRNSRTLQTHSSEHERHLPATFLRGGTSKGIYLLDSALPKDRSQWDNIFLGIMGSPDPEHGRQLNGMGGGVSSLSKIMIIGPALPDQRAQGCHIEYTFVQVGIRDSTIDYSGNCGNLSSMVGVFALDEKLCDLAEVASESRTHATVRAYNTNTQKVIETTFPLCTSSGRPDLSLPETSIAGVPGKASAIALKFLYPSGSRTGKLFPAADNAPTVDLHVEGYPRPFKASLVDATNPTVLVLTEEVCNASGIQDSSPKQLVGNTSNALLGLLESLRKAGALKMGLDPSAQAQPKIAMIQAPKQSLSGEEDADITITALSMGVPHKAVPMTVGLCLGVAANVKGTLAWDIVQRQKETRNGTVGGGESEERLVRILHPGGVVTVGAEFESGGEVRSAQVVRTGRRLMKGIVWY